MPTIGEHQPRRPIWTSDFVLLTLSTFALFCSFYFMMPTLPIYVSERLGGDQRLIGLVSSVFTLTAVAVRPIGGYLMDRYGRRGVHLVAMAGFAVAVAAYLGASTLAVLLAVRLLHGLPWGAANTAANTVAADLVPPERRGEGIGYFGMAQTLAMAVAPAAAIAIVGAERRFVVLFVSATCLALLALVLGRSVRHPKVGNPAARLSLAALFERRVGWLSVAIAFVTAGYGSVSTFIVVYAKELGVAAPGLFFTLLAAGLILARLTAGRLFDRYGPGRVLGVGYLCLGACYALLTAGRAGFFPAAVVLGMGFGTVVPSFQAMAPNMTAPERRGAAFATLLGAFDIGIGGGVYALGYVARAGGYGVMYAVAGALLLPSIVVFYGRVVPAYARLFPRPGPAPVR